MPRRYVTVLKDGVQRPEHRVIWESAHGPIPEGYEIHHKNGDGRDNRLENLQMLTHKEHRRLHARLRKEGIDVIDPSDPRVVTSREDCRKYHSRHIDECRQRDRKYYLSHKSEVDAQRKAWSDENREKVREYSRKSYRKNIEKITLKHKAYRDAHREERLDYSRKYNDAHREEHMAYNAAHKTERDAYNHAYYQMHKEVAKAQAKLYRAIKKGKPQNEIDDIRKEVESAKLAERRN